MAETIVTISVDSSVAEARLKALVSKAENLSDVFREFAEGFHKFQERQFASGGAEIGGWAPLAPATVEAKLRKGYPSDILVRTGVLLRSLVSGEAPYSVEEIEPKDMWVGTSVPYAAFHQTGTRKMPARPLIAITEALLDEWAGLVAKHMSEEKP